jgi:predicted enzyme related to lactoylglutathione lyase
VVVIDVPDINDTLSRVESLGGATLQVKQPVGDMGFAAYFKDSEGNVVGLWQSAQPAS